MNAKEIEGTASEKNAIQIGQNEANSTLHYRQSISLQVIKFNDIIAK